MGASCCQPAATTASELDVYPNIAAKAKEEADASAAEAAEATGADIVRRFARIQNLASRPELNGKPVEIKLYDQEKDKYQVGLENDNAWKLLARDKLEVFGEHRLRSGSKVRVVDSETVSVGSLRGKVGFVTFFDGDKYSVKLQSGESKRLKSACLELLGDVI
mmetsp:Transcript_91328/g.244548  ORF Transcript_91328/g.244548 Transcript_91328/m.244548 type:complete len:163 (-) Transcript_91328:129-617(-)